MSSSEILAIGSTSASQTDSHTAFKDPGSGVSSADDNRKAEVVANEARRHSKVDHLSQARELLENLCKKHVDLTDYSNSAGPSSGGLKSSTDLTKLRDQIWELFSAEKTDIDYLESAAFRNKIRLVEQGCVKHPKKKKFHFKELVDSMVVNPPKSEVRDVLTSEKIPSLIFIGCNRLFDMSIAHTQSLTSNILDVCR